MPETSERESRFAHHSRVVGVEIIRNFAASALLGVVLSGLLFAGAPLSAAGADEAAGANWPRFRGPEGSGIASFDNAPASWNAQSGEGILWKSPVPLPGENSPVIWGNRVFLAGSQGATREVYCFDADTGALLWTGAVSLAEHGAGGAEYLGAPTVATDGERVYAIYGEGEIACFNFAGEQLWARYFGPLVNNYGHASSLQAYQGNVLVQLDQGNAEDNLSALLALNGATGDVVWKTPRPVNASWSSPILVPTPQGGQFILMAEPWVISYNPADGTERWRSECIYGEVGPSPVYADGLVYTMQDGSDLCAIKADGSGDVTETHIAWWAEASLPDINSPLCDGKQLYILTSTGNLSCRDAKTGAPLWSHDLDGDYIASPAMSGDRLYVTNLSGTTTVIRASGEFEELARAELAEKVSASMAFANGRIYMRGEQNLYCIGDKPGQP